MRDEERLKEQLKREQERKEKKRQAILEEDKKRKEREKMYKKEKEEERKKFLEEEKQRKEMLEKRRLEEKEFRKKVNEIYQKQENKLKEQKILEEKLKNLNQQITQNDIINEKLLSVYKDLNKQVNGENGDFYQNEKEYTFKYYNLLEKYKHLEKLYHYYSNLQEKTERNLIEEDILNRENENNNREIDVRLKDKEIKEEYLKSVVVDIREKMVQVKEAQEEDFKEKERIRFLGRALHGRLKGLKEINDKIKKKELERKKKKKG